MTGSWRLFGTSCNVIFQRYGLQGLWKFFFFFFSRNCFKWKGKEIGRIIWSMCGLQHDFLRKFFKWEKKRHFYEKKVRYFLDFDAHLDPLISFRLICDKLPILTVIRFRHKWQMGISYLEMLRRNFFVQIIVHLLAILLRNYHIWYYELPIVDSTSTNYQLVLLYFIVHRLIWCH